MTTKMEICIKKETQLPPEIPSIETDVETVFIPIIGSVDELAHAACLASLADQSREGKLLAKAAIQAIGLIHLPVEFELIAASPGSSLSGVNLKNSKIREGTLESIEKWIRKLGGHVHRQVHALVKKISDSGDLAIVIANEKLVLGVVVLKTVKAE